MEEIFKLYLKSTKDLRAMLAERSPEEAVYDEEVLGGLRKGWSIKKAVKRAGEKYPDEALQWNKDTAATFSEHYEQLMRHEEVMAKARVFGLGNEDDESQVSEADADAETIQSPGAPGASYRVIDRLVEQKMEGDPGLAKKLAAKGKGMIVFGRKMTDEQLLDKLRSPGIHLDRASLDALRKRVLSAADLSEQLVRKHDLRFEGFEEEWIWVCLAVLWERWFPGTPSLEMIDDEIQAGYEERREAGNDRGEHPRQRPFGQNEGALRGNRPATRRTATEPREIRRASRRREKNRPERTLSVR